MSFTVLVLVLQVSGCFAGSTYTNDWGVRIESGDTAADSIATKHGFINMGQIGSLVGYYHFRHTTHPARSNVSAPDHTSRLQNETEVVWVEQQVLDAHAIKRIKPAPRDPKFSRQWHLLNQGQLGGPTGSDINMMPVWKQGVTGQGVVVVVVDTGIQHSHPDLDGNYDASVSYDYVSYDSDPSPVMDSDEWSHGTRCAGEIAAEKNDVCGVGVAYDARIGGIRLLDGADHIATDVDKSHSLGYKSQTIDIYSNSWGPGDPGKSVEGPGTLTTMTLEKGAKEGRGGRGNIYFFAAGNGGAVDDDCNCDGYANSIYTIAITALSGNGTKPWYTELCTAILAATYSGAGTETDQNITTTDTNSGCTDKHSGTSAATPLAAGMTALALQANPQLTWRDVQHLLVRTSSVVDASRDDWIVNGAGLYVSRSYGFGAMDAERLVNAARNWTKVGQQHKCTAVYNGLLPRDITWGTTLSFQSTGCRGSKNEVRYLEHVVANVTLKSSRRGSVSLSLTSPSGTSSTLLHPRKYDSDSFEGFTNWPFMTVHNWGEDPEGTWKLRISSSPSASDIFDYYDDDTITSWTLIVYGTKESPLSKSSCHTECNGCTGPGSDECLSCVNFSEKRGDATHCVPKCSPGMLPLFTHNGRNIRCVSVCEKGFYEVNNRCLPCNWTCETCSKPLREPYMSNCTTCRTGFFKYLQTCAAACPDGYYEYSDKTTKECSACNSSCKTCNNAQSCLTCSYPYVLRNGRCKRCPEGTYHHQNYATGTASCVPCHQSCKTCYGPFDDECNSCVSGILNWGSCVTSCPDGMYKETVGTDKTCRSCSSTCKSCTGPDSANCTSCKDVYFFQNQRCIDYCPFGTYRNYSREKDPCLNCNSSCLACSGPGNTDCTSCKYGQILHMNMCFQPCPDGQYRAYNKTIGPSCGTCHKVCRTCNGGGDSHCLSCYGNKILHDGQCLDTCPEGTYRRQGDEYVATSCEDCDSSCKTCYGRFSGDCSSCAANRSLHYGQCTIVCPEGTYPVNSQSTSFCRACDSSCRTCSGAWSYDCLSCNSNNILYNHRCVETCPTDTFLQDFYGSRSCQQCHWSCETCSGEYQNDCVSCEDSRILHDGECVSACPDGTYRVRTLSATSCEACDSSCNTCDGNGFSACLSCNDGRFLHDGMCVSNCPEGRHSTGYDCSKCPEGCKQCYEYKCYGCQDGYYDDYTEDSGELRCTLAGGSGTEPWTDYVNGDNGDNGFGSSGDESKTNIVAIVGGTLGAVVMVVCTVLIIRRCSGTNRPATNRWWLSYLSVRRTTGGNARMTSALGDSDRVQLTREDPLTSPTSV